MSEQDGRPSSTKQRRSRKTNNDTHQNGKPAPATQQRPTSDDTGAWKAYWKALGQPWRTEPEIDTERQKYLAERRNITPDIEQGIYPFGESKLNRADVEWLLATHENGRGPVDWNDESQRKREGLDLRGANLRRENLSGLPLARMRGGVTNAEWWHLTEEQTTKAAVQLQEAHLVGAQLQEAHLVGAQLQEADLVGAQLQKAHLVGAQVQGADLREAHLESVRLNEAIIKDEKHGTVMLADIQWGDVNLAVIDWRHVTILGDEEVAEQEKHSDGTRKDKQMRENEYMEALRANRQLAIALRGQGLNEEADRFAYRAQLLQRKVFWQHHEFGHWLFSLLLAFLSGYGYRIWRILAAYVGVVSLFALVYFVLGRYYPPHLPLHQALLESITAFHGRVFLEQFNPDTPQIWFTALEAIAGLIVEGVFVAMLIQRFFGK
jgi:hypothetical protein